LKSVSLQGRKEIDTIPANVVRAMIDQGDDQGYGRHDFLFDVKSKRLVGIYLTNENRFDPETAPERQQTPEPRFSSLFPVACWEHEIVLDPKLDAADFGLDPPAGYAYQSMAKPTNTGPCSRTSPSATSIGRSSRLTWRNKRAGPLTGTSGHLSPLARGEGEERAALRIRDERPGGSRLFFHRASLALPRHKTTQRPSQERGLRHETEVK
jgi:hypothetical protein